MSLFSAPDIPLTASLPAGDVAHGLAWTYYYGYLKLILPGTRKKQRKKKDGKTKSTLKMSHSHITRYSLKIQGNAIQSGNAINKASGRPSRWPRLKWPSFQEERIRISLGLIITVSSNLTLLSFFLWLVGLVSLWLTKMIEDKEYRNIRLLLYV